MKKTLFLITLLSLLGVWQAVGSSPSKMLPIVERLMDDPIREVYIDEVLCPLATPKVYVETDTVSVSVCNDGTEVLWDIPFEYDFYDQWGESLMPTVRDTMHASLHPDQCAVFKFKELIAFPEEHRNVDGDFRLTIRVGGYEGTDNEIAGNETDYTFSTLNGDDAYCVPNSISNEYYMSHIVGVQFNTLSNELMPMALDNGYGLMNFAKYDAAERFAPDFRVMRGLEDSLIVLIADNSILLPGLDSLDTVIPCKILVAIDYDRNGSFDDEEILLRTQFYGQRFSTPVTIPQSADFGYMRMRILVIQGNENEPDAEDMDPCMMIDRITAHDYLLFVNGDVPRVDASVNRIVSIKDHIISEAEQSIVVSVSNCGSREIESPVFHYTYTTANSGVSVSDSFAWQGTLASGRSTTVTLPSYVFPLGTTDISISIDVEGDSNVSNNAIVYQVHRFHTVRCPYIEDFEDNARADYWYAPQSDYAFNHNSWSLGKPSYNVIRQSHSGINAWSTDFSDEGVSSLGMRSYLYSPLIDISIVSIDTLSFFLNQNFMEEGFLMVEYLDSVGLWHKVSDAYFDSSNSGGYEHWQFLLNTEEIKKSLGKVTQFRFCFSMGIQDGSALDGDGCAIDDFAILHEAGDVDVAVVEIMTPYPPQRGKKIYPIVVVTNLCGEILNDVPMEYRANNGDTVREIHSGELLPGQSDTHYFSTPFICDASFPSTFSICANVALPSDTISDNDTLCAAFAIVPSDDDLVLAEYVNPQYYAVTHDSINVVVKLCNNGTYPVEQAAVYLQYNGRDEYTGDVDFPQLIGGEGLLGGQCYDYAIPQRFLVTIGPATLLTIVSLQGDIMRSNDTLESIFYGMTSVVDLAATEVVVDDSDPTSVQLRLGISNLGAQTAEDYYIGFYLDGDTSHIYRQHVTSAPLESHEVIYLPFDTTLGARADGYANITAFVAIEDDVAPANDTTTQVVPPEIDLAALSVMVRETGESFCKVTLQLQNQGNTAADKGYHISAVVNGTVLELDSQVPIAPKQTVEVAFDASIEKVATGIYTGTGRVSCEQDENPLNDTTVVVKVNVTEGIVDVDAAALWLGQNQPNPCLSETTIPFYISTPTQATLSVIDNRGRTVHTSTATYQQGVHTYKLQTSGWAAGLYHYILTTPTDRRVMKMVVR